MPPFAKDYFRAVEPTTSARTRISYAYDIRVFFHFLMENNPVYKNYTIEQFEVHDLERLEPVDIEEYQEYLKVYKNDEEKCITNTEKGLARKMSALRSFYGYYFKRQIISKNPTLLVEMPKLQDVYKRQEESRRYVVPSAPGKRFSADTKVTDMLYGCYAAAENGEDFTEKLAAIKDRYQEIIDGLGLKLSLIHIYIK